MKIHTIFALTTLLILLGTPRGASAWSSGMISESAAIHQFSTHEKIILSAYDRVRTSLPEVAAKLPPVELILRHEGVSGPDGAWAKGLDADSHHYCNPDIVSTEDAAAYVGQLSDDLSRAVAGSNSEDKTAEILAKIAHYTADAMSPPHSFGHPRADSSPIKDNWDDPNWDGHGYLDSPHFMFEADEVVVPIRIPAILTFVIALAGLILLHRRTAKDNKGRRRLLLGAIMLVPITIALAIAVILAGQGTVRHNTGALLAISPDQAERTVREGARFTLKSGVWQRFVSKGWDSSVDVTVRDVILPEAVERIAGIWAGALKN